jgi:hypothetical protein
MQPATPYRPGKYPPGPNFPQFGDDAANAVSAADEARARLAEKRISHVHFHIDRLRHDGFMPPPPVVDDWHDPLDERGTQTDPTDTKPKATQTEAYTSTGTGPDDDGAPPRRRARQPDEHLEPGDFEPLAEPQRTGPRIIGPFF